MIPALFKTERFEPLLGPDLGLVAAQPENELRQHHVLERRELRQQVMELIDETDLHAAHAGLLVVGEPAAIDAVDEHLAPVGALEKSRNMEERRLAGAGRPKQGDGFAGQEGGGGAFQDIDAAIALGVGALEPLEAKHR